MRQQPKWTVGIFWIWQKCTRHRYISGHNPYKLFILTIDYSKNFATMQSLTIEHMAMFVVKSIHIQMKWSGYGPVSCVVTFFMGFDMCLWPMCIVGIGGIGIVFSRLFHVRRQLDFRRNHLWTLLFTTICMVNWDATYQC